MSQSLRTSGSATPTNERNKSWFLNHHGSIPCNSAIILQAIRFLGRTFIIRRCQMSWDAARGQCRLRRSGSGNRRGDPLNFPVYYYFPNGYPGITTMTEEFIIYGPMRWWVWGRTGRMTMKDQQQQLRGIRMDSGTELLLNANFNNGFDSIYSLNYFTRWLYANWRRQGVG